jgi:hypothetical protein
VRLALHRGGGQAGHLEQLLALHLVRRRVESRPRGTPQQPRLARVTPTPVAVESEREGLIRVLREVIAALDRRRPQQQRAGEPSIEQSASALRADAVKQLAALGSCRV